MTSRWALAMAMLVLVLARGSRANQSGPTGDLSSVGLPPEPRVALEREVVRIRHDDGTGDAEWTADCTLTFRNLTREEFDVVMGQPDWEPVGQYEDWVLTEFEATVDGSLVPAAPASTSISAAGARWIPGYRESAWNWSVHFRPSATVEVRTRYAFKGIIAVGPIGECILVRDGLATNPPFWTTAPPSPSGAPFGCCDWASVGYMGHGGRAWAGTIAEAVITIELPKQARLHLLTFFPPPSRVDRQLATWRFTDQPPRDVWLMKVKPDSHARPWEWAEPPLFELAEQARAWTAYAERNHLSSDAILSVLEGYLHRHPESSASLAQRAARAEEDRVEQRSLRLLADPALPASEAEIMRELLRAAASAPR